MAVYSQNGYIANDETLLGTFTVPGSKVRLRLRRGPVAEVLLYLAARFDDEVEDIDTAGSFITDAKPSIPGGEPSRVDDDWSTAFRNIRDSTAVLSNHASGTAIDLNATQHPRGVRGTYTKEQIKRVRAILSTLVDPLTKRSVVRWGEDYQSAPTDGMHFEINAGEQAVARVAALIKEVEMALTDDDARKLWGYDQQGKRRQAWSYLQTADANARAARLDAAKTLAIVEAMAAKPQGLTTEEIAAAAQRGAAAALDEKIDSVDAQVQLNVTQGGGS